jgi:hypothetical protein
VLQYARAVTAECDGLSALLGSAIAGFRRSVGWKRTATNRSSLEVNLERNPLIVFGRRAIGKASGAIAGDYNLGETVPGEPSSPPLDPVSVEQL